MKKNFLLILLCTVIFAQTAEEIALKTENTLRSYRTFQADFKQFYFSTTIATPLEEEGRVYFQKPDLMKWEYQYPEKKIFLLKEDKILFYDQEENELIEDMGENEQYEAEILDLLSGEIGLLKQYDVEISPFPTDDKNAYQLKLISKNNDDGTFILIEINEKTWLIQKAVFIDWAGNKTEFHFNKLKINLNFPKNMFELNLPEDVAIIRD
ncbi:MAG: outer membrane lipoprotein carrier protein LolA [Candidatus Aminicenantes bacterium]|nr:outer membrane lipoprotein carrier protein LolA [Candidatus Aminicenantes bacterium]